MALVSLLPDCDNQEKLALLQLFSLMAKDKPSVYICFYTDNLDGNNLFFQLLEASLPQLCEYLNSSVTVTPTLQIFLHMAEKKPALLLDHINAMKQAAQRHPQTVCLAARIIGAVGKLSRVSSQRASNQFIKCLNLG